MPETVLLTTSHLESAARLRGGFQDAGYRVELLAPSESVGDYPEAVLLVVTGAPAEKRSRRLAREAAGMDHLPVMAIFDSDAAPGDEECRRAGFAECFGRGVDPEEVVLVGRRLVERRRLRQVTGIVGETEPMREVLERVLQFAPVNATVLITGESGTGKELVARGVHALSPRRHKPFIAANVAALPDTLLESELFGHEKGAFTGAIAQRKGLFELSNRGTLFLDEIGEMPLPTQTKLLRVLEEHEFMRVGGEQPIRSDVRVVAATNQDLRDQVQLGKFRRDLYYRLNVLHIRMPSLRERRDDIPLLVDAFVREIGRMHDRPLITLDPAALAILVDYDWPGNVRELRNLVESMVVLSPGKVIRPEDIPPPVRGGRRQRALMPVPTRTSEQAARTGGVQPELEFVFRTLVDLRMDVEELRERFDEFRRQQAVELPPRAPYAYPVLTPGAAVGASGSGRSLREEEIEEAEEIHEPEEDLSAGEVVVYRPGMSLQDLEREAITVALKEVKGNRRKAAELLGIGERTLYRKIKEYELPL